VFEALKIARHVAVDKERSWLGERLGTAAGGDQEDDARRRREATGGNVIHGEGLCGWAWMNASHAVSLPRGRSDTGLSAGFGSPLLDEDQGEVVPPNREP
jgi:hypothetical protein